MHVSIKEQILQDLKTAMKEKDVQKRDALRLLSSAFKQIEVDERKELSDEDVIKIIQKQLKQRNDSIEQYQKAGRDDLAQKEQLEIDYYRVYLPAQLSDEELEAAVLAIIEKTGASSMKDMGKVMGAATKELAGKAEGKRVSACVKKLLAS